MEEIAELNQKIAVIINRLGLTSSKFADYIDVSRPIISHIIAGRNKPSLEIIQKILAKFPELGIEWTFDGNLLDDEMLTILADRVERDRYKEETHKLRESNIFDSPLSLPGIFNSQAESNSTKTNKKITKIVVFYEDQSFSEFNPS